MLGSYEVVNITWVDDENPNLWWTLRTPLVKLENGDTLATRSRAINCH
jgi:hypothetical protein